MGIGIGVVLAVVGGGCAEVRFRFVGIFGFCSRNSNIFRIVSITVTEP